MVSKIAGLARLLAVLLAIIAGLIALPGFDVATALIILGAIAGIGVPRENLLNILVAALVLPVLAGVLGGLPAVGAQLGDIFGNFATAVAGGASVAFLINLYHMLMGDVKGLGGSGS